MTFNKLAVGIVSGTAGVATGVFLERKGYVKVPDFIARKYAAYKAKAGMKKASEDLAKHAKDAAEASMKAAADAVKSAGTAAPVPPFPASDTGAV
jgi:hypothetical protein